MRITAGFAEVVDDACQRRDGLLSSLRTRQISIQRLINDLDHQFRDKARKSNQHSVTAIDQCLQQKLIVARHDRGRAEPRLSAVRNPIASERDFAYPS